MLKTRKVNWNMKRENKTNERRKCTYRSSWAKSLSVWLYDWKLIHSIHVKSQFIVSYSVVVVNANNLTIQLNVNGLSKYFIHIWCSSVQMCDASATKIWIEYTHCHRHDFYRSMGAIKIQKPRAQKQRKLIYNLFHYTI